MISVDMVLEGLLAVEACFVAVGAGVGEHALEVQALDVVAQLPPTSAQLHSLLRDPEVLNIILQDPYQANEFGKCT